MIISVTFNGIFVDILMDIFALAWKPNISVEKIINVLKTGSINQRNRHNKTAFGVICANRNTNGMDFDTLEFCIRTLKADLNLKDNTNCTPFISLCKDGIDLRTLKYCVKYGKADLNDKDSDHCTAFYWICHTNPITKKMLKFCLKHGADLNYEDIGGNSPMRWICESSLSLGILKYCIQKGNFHVNKTNKQTGNTLLYEICHLHHLPKFVKIILYLIESGANIDMPTNNKFRDMCVCHYHGNTDIITRNKYYILIRCIDSGHIKNKYESLPPDLSGNEIYIKYLLKKNIVTRHKTNSRIVVC